MRRLSMGSKWSGGECGWDLRFRLGTLDGEGEIVGNRPQLAILRGLTVKMRLSLGRFLVSLTPVLIGADPY